MQENNSPDSSPIPLPRVYSLDESITRKKLQSPEYNPPIFNPLRMKAMQEFIHKHNIHYYIFRESSYHYKFLKVKSKPQIMYYM